MLREIKKWSTIILVLLSIIECFLFYNLENIIGCCVLLYGWILLCTFVYKLNVLYSHPVIFVVSLGVGVFYYYFPLVGTLISNRPLTYEFRLPFDTFFHQFIYINTYIIAFLLYTKISYRPFVTRGVLKKLNMFEVPSDMQLWLMGFLGIGVFLYTQIVAGITQLENDEVSVFVRFLIPVSNFIYAPILLLFKSLYSTEKFKNKKSLTTLIYLYIICIVIISFYGNSREFMIKSIVFLALLFVFDLLYFQRKIYEIISFKKIIVILGVIFIVMGPMAKMARAMLLVRGIRTEISAKELFVKTLEAYRTVDKEIIDIAEEDQLRQFDWDEEYTGNVFFDRLCNLRVADMTIYFVNMLNYEERDPYHMLGEKLLAQIPGPLLKTVGIDFNKYDILSTYTVSSLARFKITGYGSSGKSVASHTGTGLYIWGAYYPLYFIVIYFLLFLLFDSFVLINKSQYNISIFFYINIYYFFTFLNYKNGIVTDLIFLTRPYVQLIVMYIVIFNLTKIIVSAFRRN